MKINKNDIPSIQKELEGSSAEEVLGWVGDNFAPSKMALASSMAMEDQVLTEMIFLAGNKIPIFTLDTGRLFPETYNLISETMKKY